MAYFAVERAEQLSDLRQDYRSRLQDGGRAHLVVDMLFANPILTVRYVQDKLNVSQPGATNILRRLAAAGIVEQSGIGPGVRIGGSAATCLRLHDVGREWPGRRRGRRGRGRDAPGPALQLAE